MNEQGVIHKASIKTNNLYTPTTLPVTSVVAGVSLTAW